MDRLGKHMKTAYPVSSKLQAATGLQTCMYLYMLIGLGHGLNGVGIAPLFCCLISHSFEGSDGFSASVSLPASEPLPDSLQSQKSNSLPSVAGELCRRALPIAAHMKQKSASSMSMVAISWHVFGS